MSKQSQRRNFDRHGQRKYALSLDYCHQLGTSRAAYGTPWSELLAELTRDGYKANGLTVQRVKRAYDQQIARG